MKKNVYKLVCCSMLSITINTFAQVVPSSYQVGTWKDFKTASVSYTFDDNLPGQQSTALPLFDKYGFKITFFSITTAGAGAAPNWTKIKAASANGHDISSHTVTHPSSLATLTLANQDSELKNSQSTIIQNVPTTKCLTIAYPNCIIGDLATLQKYYIAGRICDGQIMGKTPSNFYQLSSITTGNTGSINTATAWNSKVTSAKSSGGWCVFLTHAIDNESGYSPTNSTELNTHLGFMNTNKADYWIGTFTDVVKYIKERNAINITETSINVDSLKLTPTDNLDNSIYDIGVTVRRQLPSTWTDARVKIGTTIVASSIVTINNIKYIQFDIIPDKGIYTISNPAASNNSCTTLAPTVTANITYNTGDVASKLTATGTGLKWYTVASGGTSSNTAPTPSTTSAGVTTYYVTQTLNSCESPMASITITVINAYKIFKTPTPIVVDGTVDAIWNNSSVLPISATKLLSGAVINAADLSGTLKALWDDTYLYVLSDITDDTKMNDSPNAYDDDAVEVYLDVNNDKATTYSVNDFQYTFGWNDGTTVGVLPSGHSNTGITYSAVSKTGGYIVETRIPWSTITGTPVVNQLIGLDFMINDDDDGSARDGKLSWNSATDMAYQDPSLFGTAQLREALVVTSLDDSQNYNNSIISPNPFTNQINVAIDGAFDYQLLNSMGEIIQSNSSTEKTILLNNQNLQNGLYLLKIIQNEQIRIFKIIKE